MKVKVKKTLIPNRDEWQTILAALDKCDGHPFPQMSDKGKKSEGPTFEAKCANLAAAIRKEYHTL